MSPRSSSTMRVTVVRLMRMATVKKMSGKTVAIDSMELASDSTLA